MILYIDTSKRNEVKVRIEIKGGFKEKITRNVQSQNVLEFINKLLKANRIKLTDIKEIKVETGPGSFTGLRVGISVANALGFALKIPVNGKKAGEVQPIYDK